LEKEGDVYGRWGDKSDPVPVDSIRALVERGTKVRGGKMDTFHDRVKKKGKTRDPLNP